MRVRWLKRGVLWVIQAGVMTGLAWYLLHWNYQERLSDLVPWSIPTFHHLKMLFVAMTLITGGLASLIALIFAARVEQRPLAYTPGVMLCTCVVLWAYTFFALEGQDGFEVNSVFLGGRGWEFYCVIVALWMGVVNGVLSLVAGGLNAPAVVVREAFNTEPRPRRVRLVDAVVSVVAAKEAAVLEGDKRGKPRKAKTARKRTSR